MQIVNVTTKTVFVQSVGMMRPGAISSGRGRDSRRLEETLEAVVKTCKGCLGIRLNRREADLLNQLIELDERGSKFSPDQIPEELRNDPDGSKRALADSLKAQMSEQDALARKNAEALRREEEINGETLVRKPVGPATLKGEKVDPSTLKGGFEQIMAENARIAAGRAEEKKDVNEILDPIGVHAKGIDRGDSKAPDVTVSEPASAIGVDPVSVEQAKGRADDGTRSADAEFPAPAVPPRGGRMDAVAADIADQLATMGPPDKKARGRGRGKKAK